MSPSVYAVATMDTKGHELAFVADRLRAAGVAVVTVDVGTMEPPVVVPDVDRPTVAGCHPTASGTRPARFRQADRGQAITAMSEALEVLPASASIEAGRVVGVIGIGGSGGTAPDHARDAGAADRPAQAHGLDGRQRQHRPLRRLERHHDDVLGRRRRRAQRRLAPGARQRRRRHGRHGPAPDPADRTRSRRWA